MTIYQDTKKSTTYKFLKDLKGFVIKNKITLNKPIITGNDYNYIKKSMKELEISTYGSYTKFFEKKIKDYTKSKFVLCTNSGTSALHLSLLVIDINQNHEVFLPAFNFVASANAIKYCNATPHFLDIESENLGVDPNKFLNYVKKNFIFKNDKLINKKTKKHLKAIILVYSYGHPPKIENLMKICKKFKIKVIEDSAEALGTFYKKKHAGTIGDIGILSFNGNKIITTGAGGAILTNSRSIFKKASDLATLAKKQKKDFEYKFVAYNYRMASINASLGLSQLEDINLRISKRRKLYEKYVKIFSKSSGIKIFKEPKYSKSNYWSQLLILKSKSKRKNFLEVFRRNKIKSVQGWNLISDLKHFKNCPKSDLSNSKKISSLIINLPSSI